MPVTTDNIGTDADDIYNALISAHEGLSEDESAALDARLVLLFANEIGNLDRINALIGAARQSC